MSPKAKLFLDSAYIFLYLLGQKLKVSVTTLS